MLRLDNFSIKRGDLVLKSALDFSLQYGQIGQVLGKNGAGKSTLFAQIAGLLPSQGMVRHEVPLYISHHSLLCNNLSVRQNLAFLMALDGQKVSDKALDDALGWAGLYGYEDERGFLLSAGQKRRAVLARLYLSKRAFWLLDEPFTALDSDMVASLAQKMRHHANQGGAVLFTSHQTGAHYDVCLQL